MKSKTYCLLCLFGLFSISINAQAALIYQLDNRYTNHTHPAINPYGQVTPTTPFADFHDSRFLEAGTFQNSTLTSTTMSGIGSTSGTQDSFLAGAFSTSYFDITFIVDELTDFSLSGYLDADYDFGVLSVSLLQNGIEVFSIDPLSSTSTGFIYTYDYTGQLSTGNTYQLVATSDYSELGFGYDETWQFDLATVSAVPIPAASWLFASGMLALFGFAKRNKAWRAINSR